MDFFVLGLDNNDVVTVTETPYIQSAFINIL